MRTERGYPLDLITQHLLVTSSKPMETGRQEGEWKRPKSEEVLTKVTGILMTLFQCRFEGSSILHLVSSKPFPAIALAQLVPKRSLQAHCGLSNLQILWGWYLDSLLYFRHGSGFSHTTKVQGKRLSFLDSPSGLVKPQACPRKVRVLSVKGVNSTCGPASPVSLPSPS